MTGSSFLGVSVTAVCVHLSPSGAMCHEPSVIRMLPGPSPSCLPHRRPSHRTDMSRTEWPRPQKSWGPGTGRGAETPQHPHGDTWFKDWKRGGADEDAGVPEHESIAEVAVGTQPRVFSGIAGEAQKEEAPELQGCRETPVLSTP